MSSRAAIKSGIHRLNYPVECAFEPSADSEKNALKVSMCTYLSLNIMPAL